MKRFAKVGVVAGIVLGLAAAAAPAGASTSKTCYKASDDVDADGYAKSGASPVSVSVSSTALNCPSGYVGKAGDCQDGSAAVHPRRSEIAFNNVDDDCTEGVDQSEPTYSASGNGNTNNSFTMQVIVKETAVAALKPATGEVEVERLGSNNPVKRPKQSVTINNFYGVRWVSVPVGGLAETTVYRARIRFFNSTGGAVGKVSTWYYTTTTGPENKSIARTAIVLKGFKQLGDSDDGLVGYRGTVNVNGTRYGASTNEKWCSEFYSWTSKDRLKNMAGRSSVDGMIFYFGSYGAWYTGSNIATWGRRGDYVGMDTNDDGKKNHSGMFLALEVSGGKTFGWTLEGNTGNTVGVQKREVGAEIMGLGHITDAMLS